MKKFKVGDYVCARMRVGSYDEGRMIKGIVTRVDDEGRVIRLKNDERMDTWCIEPRDHKDTFPIGRRSVMVNGETYWVFDFYDLDLVEEGAVGYLVDEIEDSLPSWIRLVKVLKSGMTGGFSFTGEGWDNYRYFVAKSPYKPAEAKKDIKITIDGKSIPLDEAMDVLKKELDNK
jgi:hypothetical protein